jgi:hypothetical protein
LYHERPEGNSHKNTLELHAENPFDTWPPGGGPAGTAASPSSFDTRHRIDKQWHHGTWIKQDKVISFYLDGMLTSTEPFEPYGGRSLTQYGLVGGRRDNSSVNDDVGDEELFVGEVAQVYIFHKAVEPAVIDQLAVRSTDVPRQCAKQGEQCECSGGDAAYKFMPSAPSIYTYAPVGSAKELLHSPESVTCTESDIDRHWGGDCTKLIDGNHGWGCDYAMHLPAGTGWVAYAFTSVQMVQEVKVLQFNDWQITTFTIEYLSPDKGTTTEWKLLKAYTGDATATSVHSVPSPYVAAVAVRVTMTGQHDCCHGTEEARLLEIYVRGYDSRAVTVGSSCNQLYRLGAVQTGVYLIKPKGYAGDPFKVYCEQAQDGGGWTKILHTAGTQPWGNSPDGYGDITLSSDALGGVAKLSDVQIRAIQSLSVDGGFSTFRFYTNSHTYTRAAAYIRTTFDWDNEQRGMGLLRPIENSINKVFGCESISARYATCDGAWIDLSRAAYIDSHGWGDNSGWTAGNNEHRYFLDYDRNNHCYAGGEGRCFSAGMTTGHATHPNMIMFVREEREGGDEVSPHGKDTFRYILQPTLRSWHESEQACIKLGDKCHLASIQNANDQQNIATLLTANTWFGLKSSIIDGGTKAWLFEDGTPFLFTDGWSANEPNSGALLECGYLRKDRQYMWDDNPCSSKKQSVCKCIDSDSDSESMPQQWSLQWSLPLAVVGSVSCTTDVFHFGTPQLSAATAATNVMRPTCWCSITPGTTTATSTTYSTRSTPPSPTTTRLNDDIEYPVNNTNVSAINSTGTVTSGPSETEATPPPDRAKNGSSAPSSNTEKSKSLAGTVVPVVLVVLCLAASALVLLYRRQTRSAATLAAAHELDRPQIIAMMHNPLCNNLNHNEESTFIHGADDGDGNGGGGGDNDGIDGGGEAGYLHVVGSIDAGAGGGARRGQNGSSDAARLRCGSSTYRVISTSISNPHIVFSIPMEDDHAGTGTGTGSSAGVAGASRVGGNAWETAGWGAYAEIENCDAPLQNGLVEGAEYAEIDNYAALHLASPAAEVCCSETTTHAGVVVGGSRVVGATRSPVDYSAADGSEQTYAASSTAQYSAANGGEEVYASGTDANSDAAQYSTADGSEMMYEAAAAPQSVA